MRLNRVSWEKIAICNSSSAFCTWSEMSLQNITTALDTSVRSVIGFVASLWYIASYWIRSILESLSLHKSHCFYMFLFPFNEKHNLHVWWMGVSKLYFLYSCLISKSQTMFMCSLIHTHHTYNNPHKSRILPQSHLAVKKLLFFTFVAQSFWRGLYCYSI